MSESNSRLQQKHGQDLKRDPTDPGDSAERDLREKMLDKTLADSFPTGDPPSTIPDPGAEDSFAPGRDLKSLFSGLTPGTWVALSLDSTEVFATGATRDEAEQNARTGGHRNMTLTKVPLDSDAPLQSSTEAA